MNSSNLIQQAQDLIPESLDEIVRINRDLLKLEYANSEDLSRLATRIQNTNFKGTLVEAFLYKRLTKLSEVEPICAVGYLITESGKVAFHTSRVVGVDNDQKIIVTASGSHYMISSFADTRQTDSTLLLHICHVAHRDGWGTHFGIPEIYY
ncbi:hypothetical protein [Methylophilus sp.]|uniref:hypothetical protein n=1 Tax=Methylophilus sp. TaxID=29541 RepID=UPI0011DA384E|nr:hypothetical protein [Methylophilus sp.]TXI45038.1 MAG: hypothetical protein E6Q52_07330 [Methylophilus sp.]